MENYIPGRNNNSTERIVNGEDADNQAHVVRISAYNTGNTKKEGYGSLITRRHVLTLASLIKG